MNGSLVKVPTRGSATAAGGPTATGPIARPSPLPHLDAEAMDEREGAWRSNRERTQDRHAEDYERRQRL